MLPETRAVFHRYLDRQAELNGCDAEGLRRGEQFTIEPTVQQVLIDKQQESSAFLAAINVTQVTELKGEKLGLGVSGPIASRTNTDNADRATVDPTTLDEAGFELVKTNSDTHVKYAKLDTWAKFPDFQVRMRDAILKRQALDRIMVGFNGISAAAQTNPVTYPLRQDVNKGWLHHIRTFDAGSHVLAEGGKEDGKIIIGADKATTDYRNVHALVTDAVHNLLPSWARQDNELVVILGEDLQHDTFFPLVNSDLVPTETLAADLILSSKRVGGKRAVSVPYFPANGLLITRLDNLSIYEQAGRRRRTVVDNAKRDRIETYESYNDGYVIEDMDFACLLENIQFGPTDED